MLEKLGKTFEYKKLTEAEQKQRGILGRLIGPCADFIQATRNGRKYSEELWENVFSNDLMKEKIKNRCCFGELGHPTDRTETDMEKIALCLAELPKKGSDGKLYGVFDILDTPNGRILKALCDYGCNIGISSRGQGDLITDLDGNEAVDPDTYDCECFDAVLMPGVEAARLKYVTESLNKENSKGLKLALTESLKKASDDDRKIMEETLKDLNITLDEEEKSEDKIYSVYFADEFVGHYPAKDESEASMLAQEDYPEIYASVNPDYWVDYEEIIPAEEDDINPLEEKLENKIDEDVKNRILEKIKNKNIKTLKADFEDENVGEPAEKDEESEKDEEPSIEVWGVVFGNDKDNFGDDEEWFDTKQEALDRIKKGSNAKYALLSKYLVFEPDEIPEGNPEETKVYTSNFTAEELAPSTEEAAPVNEAAEELKDEHKCCICGEPIEGHGNNPFPVKTEGDCCDKCNAEVVIPARIEKMKAAASEKVDEELTETESEEVKPTSEESEEESLEEKEVKELTEDEKREIVLQWLTNNFEEDQVEEVLDILNMEIVEDDDEEESAEDEDVAEDKKGSNEAEEAEENIENSDEEDSEQEENAEEDKAVDEGLDSIVNSLQEALSKNSDLENTVRILQEKLAVSDAKVNEINEECNRLKNSMSRMSDLVKTRATLKENVSTLEKSLNEKEALINEQKVKIAKLVESKKETVRSSNELNENLTNLKTSYEKQIQTLNEQISSSKTENEKQISALTENLNKANSLKESYKKLANKTVNKYIEVKANIIGQTPADIKRKLGESYTLEDVDQVCEDLKAYSLNVSKLPFEVTKKVGVRVTESTNTRMMNNTTKKSAIYDDEVSDTLIRLANSEF